MSRRHPVVETLKLRKEKAGLLGFETHAEVSLATKMAGTVAAVDQMNDELTAASRPGMQRDIEEHIESHERVRKQLRQKELNAKKHKKIQD